MMVTIPIPLPGTPLFDERVTLDGVDYVLTFDWHQREERWYLTVADSNGAVITAGIKLVPDWPLYQRETLPNSPKGNFLSTGPLPPDLASFGLRTFLLYVV